MKGLRIRHAGVTVWYIDKACNAKCRQYRNQLNATPRGNVLDRRVNCPALSHPYCAVDLRNADGWTRVSVRRLHACVCVCASVSHVAGCAWTTGWNYRAIVRVVTRHNGGFLVAIRSEPANRAIRYYARFLRVVILAIDARRIKITTSADRNKIMAVWNKGVIIWGYSWGRLRQ